MTEEEKKDLILTLQSIIKYSEKLWNEGNNPGYIVGYLQGRIKSVITELEPVK